MTGAGVDWDGLRAAAVEAAGRAYAPYSGLRVGAAALVRGAGGEPDRVVAGCNVENASYGLTLCAECGLVSALHASGGGRLVAFVCVGMAGAAAGGEPELLAPCGRCRQLLREHGGRDLLLLRPSGVRTLEELLPDSFGPEDLP